MHKAELASTLYKILKDLEDEKYTLGLTAEESILLERLMSIMIHLLERYDTTSLEQLRTYGMFPL